jgi:hypothetical protein
MRAWMLMAIAVGLFILHRWATGQPAVTLPILLSGAFAIFVIALLDGGKTEPVAKGFAWLFLVVSAYRALPAFTGALNSAKKAAAKTKGGGSRGTFD